MKRAVACLLSLVGLLALAPGARARVVEKVAAVVGNDIVLASEVEEKAAMLMAALSKKGKSKKQKSAVEDEGTGSPVEIELSNIERARLVPEI